MKCPARNKQKRIHSEPLCPQDRSLAFKAISEGKRHRRAGPLKQLKGGTGLDRGSPSEFWGLLASHLRGIWSSAQLSSTPLSLPPTSLLVFLFNPETSKYVCACIHSFTFFIHRHFLSTCTPPPQPVLSGAGGPEVTQTAPGPAFEGRAHSPQRAHS